MSEKFNCGLNVGTQIELMTCDGSTQKLAVLQLEKIEVALRFGANRDSMVHTLPVVKCSEQ
jgi:hypothetical protein